MHACEGCLHFAEVTRVQAGACYNASQHVCFAQKYIEEVISLLRIISVT